MKSLTSTTAVDQLLASESPVWIFKHSNACGVSSGAHTEVQQYEQAHGDETIGIIVVQTERPVSNHVAEVTGVRHASPQVFLVAKGEVLWNASHFKITKQAMEDARASVGA